MVTRGNTEVDELKKPPKRKKGRSLKTGAQREQKLGVKRQNPKKKGAGSSRRLKQEAPKRKWSAESRGKMGEKGASASSSDNKQ